MSASQNKLRNKKKNKLIPIYIGIILLFLHFYLCATAHMYI